MKTFKDIKFYHSELGTNFIDYEKQPFKDSVKLYLKFGKVGYIHKDNVPEVLKGKYKVLIAKAGTIKLKPFIIDKDDYFTETFNCIYLTDNKKEAENIKSYFESKLIRFLASLRKTTQHFNQHHYSFIPVLNFKEEWTNSKLYELFNLTKEEIEYIEQRIDLLK
jgi:hypothetical protein